MTHGNEFQVVDRQTEKWVFQGSLTECEDYHAESDMGDMDEILLFDPNREQQVVNPIP